MDQNGVKINYILRELKISIFLLKRSFNKIEILNYKNSHQLSKGITKVVRKKQKKVELALIYWSESKWIKKRGRKHQKVRWKKI